jgi:hypothetical protein
MRSLAGEQSDQYEHGKKSLVALAVAKTVTNRRPVSKNHRRRTRELVKSLMVAINPRLRGKLNYAARLSSSGGG